MTHPRETHRITWRGIVIEIRYEAQWLGDDGPFATAHLEIEAIDPDRSPLPMTETGYRSHFTQASAIAEAGGPVAFVEAWLAADAGKRGGTEKEDAARQMTLF